MHCFLCYIPTDGIDVPFHVLSSPDILTGVLGGPQKLGLYSTHSASIVGLDYGL